jgi:hypothetical protein
VARAGRNLRTPEFSSQGRKDPQDTRRQTVARGGRILRTPEVSSQGRNDPQETRSP